MKTFLGVLLLAAVVQANIFSKATPRDIVVEPAPKYNWRDDERITGGLVAQAQQFPYQVGLFLTATNGAQYFCGGSLISVNYVMTAAHCADGIASALVILGAQNILTTESTQVRLTSTKLTVHSGWNRPRLLNDIAVIHLPSSVTLNANIQLLTLPSQADASATFENDKATVSGWGKTSDFATSISPVLRYVILVVIPNTKCSSAFPGYITSSHICCSGAGGKSSCNGDSGGPLTVSVSGVTKQIGIVSFGSGRGCTKGYPSVYTRVTSFLTWIGANTDVVIN